VGWIVRRGVWLLFAALAIGAAPEDDPDFGAEKLGRIETLVNEAAALRDTAIKQGEAIRLSCVSEKLKRLRVIATSARHQADIWPRNFADPKLRTKAAKEINELEARAKALTAEAHACVEVRPDELKVEVVTDLPHMPPPGVPPPPPIERPPLASPF
jgi:hypothetical protein